MPSSKNLEPRSISENLVSGDFSSIPSSLEASASVEAYGSESVEARDLVGGQGKSIGEQGSHLLVSRPQADPATFDFSTPDQSALQDAADAAPEMIQILIGIARCKPEDASNRIKAATTVLQYALGLPKRPDQQHGTKRKSPAELRALADSLGLDVSKLLGKG